MATATRTIDAEALTDAVDKALADRHHEETTYLRAAYNRGYISDEQLDLADMTSDDRAEILAEIAEILYEDEYKMRKMWQHHMYLVEARAAYEALVAVRHALTGEV